MREFLERGKDKGVKGKQRVVTQCRNNRNPRLGVCGESARSLRLGGPVASREGALEYFVHVWL